MTEQVLPHSIEAEQAVLGGLMLEPTAFARIADWLTADDFYRDSHRLIFSSFAALAEKGKPCDAVTLGEWFQEQGIAEDVGGASYIIHLANNSAGAANIAAYAEIVVEKARLRNAVDVGAELAADAIKPQKSSADVIANATHKLSMLSASHARGGLQPVKPAMKRLFAEMMERKARGPQLLGLPTPWHELNKALNGLRDGTLYVCGARPSMGKSIFAGMIAAFTALRGQRAGFFAVEGTTEELLSRAIAAHGDIPFDWVEQPDDKAQDAELLWSRYANIASALTESPLLIDDTSYIRVEALQARARREHLRKPFRLLVIDHLHDMDHGGGDAQRVRMEIGRAVQGAKTLAKEFNCPVLLNAQLNRGVTGRADKRPTLSDLRESGEIEQKADVVLFLHREDYYDTDERKTHLQGVIEVIPAKGRNIRVGKTIHLANRFDRMRMDDWEGPLPEAPRAKETEGNVARWRKRA